MSARWVPCSLREWLMRGRPYKKKKDGPFERRLSHFKRAALSILWRPTLLFLFFGSPLRPPLFSTADVAKRVLWDRGEQASRDVSRTSKSVRRLSVAHSLARLQGWRCYWCMLTPPGVSLKEHLGSFIPDMKVEGNIIEAPPHGRGFSSRWEA